MKQNRRIFLQKAGVITAATTILPHFTYAKPALAKKKLGIALVGLGYYSTDLLAPALQLTEHCELTGIVTGSPDKIPVWKKKYGIKNKNIYSYDNFDDIANNDEIDVIYIVLPPSLHAEYSIRAAQAGKHVWCEKPMAPSVADCEAMIKACNDNKVKLSIGYRCQHDPNIQAYMKAAKEQPFGKVKMITSAAGYFDGRSNHWKQNKALGGGVLGDMGVYAIQGARLAAGEEPISVMAQTYTNRPEIYHEVEETAIFQMEFPSGARASCQTSFGIAMNHLKVTYEKGNILMEPHSSYTGNNGVMSDGTIINFPINNQQAKQMDDDALALKLGNAMMVPGEEGLRDIRVVEALYKSAALHDAVKV